MVCVQMYRSTCQGGVYAIAIPAESGVPTGGETVMQTKLPASLWRFGLLADSEADLSFLSMNSKERRRPSPRQTWHGIGSPVRRPLFSHCAASAVSREQTHPRIVGAALTIRSRLYFASHHFQLRWFESPLCLCSLLIALEVLETIYFALVSVNILAQAIWTQAASLNAGSESLQQ